MTVDLPPAIIKVIPDIDVDGFREQVIDLLLSHAVAGPGDTLVMRVKDWTEQQVDGYQQHLDRLAADRGLPFKVLAVMGDDMAVVKQQPAAPDPVVPGMPTHAVVVIEWTEDGEDRSRKFGPWGVDPGELYATRISEFVNGWTRGSGIEPAHATLTTGDAAIAEGATYPYWRDAG
jgi:hypothetical protein